MNNHSCISQATLGGSSVASPVAPRKPQIEAEMDELEQNLAHACRAFDQLAGRIDAVMITVPAEACAKNATPQPNRTPLAARIYNLRERAECLAAFIEHITNRVEL